MKKIKTTILSLIICQTLNAQSAEDGRYVSIYSGYSLLSSNLSGTGFNADLPQKGGPLYGFDLAYQSADTSALYILKYSSIHTEQSSPTGITPSKMRIDREDYSFIGSFTPWDSGALENLRLGIGYGFLQSAGTNTSPNNVLTKQRSQGALFLLSFNSKLPSDWSVLSELLIYLPHQVKESNQVTGYNPQFISTELKLVAEYIFTDNSILFGGVGYRSDQVSYNGSVSRGVTDGKDKRTLLSFPVGIKFGY